MTTQANWKMSKTWREHKRNERSEERVVIGFSHVMPMLIILGAGLFGSVVALPCEFSKFSSKSTGSRNDAHDIIESHNNDDDSRYSNNSRYSVTFGDDQFFTAQEFSK